MAPTLGMRLPFFAPLPASAKWRAKSDASQQYQFLCARLLLKDWLGLFLGLPRAPIRAARFDARRGSETTTLNDGRTFAISEKIGARPFKIHFTENFRIVVHPANPYFWDSPQEKIVKSATIAVPVHIGVNNMISWLAHQQPTWTDENGAKSPEIPGLAMKLENYSKIVGLTTPEGIWYPFRGPKHTVYPGVSEELQLLPNPEPNNATNKA